MSKYGSLCLSLLVSFSVAGFAVALNPNEARGADALVCYKVKKDFRGNSSRTQLDVQNDGIGGDGSVEVKTNKAQFVCSPADVAVDGGTSEGASESQSQSN